MLHLTSFGFSLRYWTRDCLNWPCWILIPLTVSSCSDKAWDMQFPDPWLSEILKPLSDTILDNSSVKEVLLLTVLAQSCICWRFWRVGSSSPWSKIILGVFPWIKQCIWKRTLQLWQRKKITLKTEFSVFHEYLWRNIRPNQGWEGHWSNRVLWFRFYGGCYPQMNVFMRTQIALFSATREDFKIKKYEELSVKSFRRQPNNSIYIYQTLSFDLRMRNSIGMKRRR